MPHIEIGLDQQLSMPSDSYVLSWFRDVSRFLSVGPPVYFVITPGLNYTSRNHQNLICGGSGCLQESLLGQMYGAAQISHYTHIAQPASSWLDDYFSWVIPHGSPSCCRVYDTTPLVFCNSSVHNDTCHTCNITITTGGDGAPRPAPKDFMTYFPFFMRDNPGVYCSKGGHAAYSTAVDYNTSYIGASYFMTYHTILTTSQQYIDALRKAREVCNNITHTIHTHLPNDTSPDVQVFPYSVFYVFYEQYLTIVKQTWIQLLSSLAAVFTVTFLLMGLSIHVALIVVFIISCILINMLGIMYIWDISLNAVSLVNLVMCVGISVEFCSHIIRSFVVSVSGDRVSRAHDALLHMGSSVFSGITLTKFSGIVVLAFSHSQMFQVFFFRMYLSMVILGFSYGLVLLPVLLTYIGPGVNKKKLYDVESLSVGNSVAGVDKAHSPAIEGRGMGSVLDNDVGAEITHNTATYTTHADT